MQRVGLTRLSWAEKNDLWRRWLRGESYKTIAEALRRAPESVRRVVVAEGGVAPKPRRRSRLALTTAEREEISRGLARGLSLRGLARALNRAPSTLSREIRRNQGRGGYRASRAEHRAWCQSCRPKPYRLASSPALRRMVARKLAVQWSPQQIAHWLRHTFPSDADMHVSHETIYRSLFVQSRGLLKRTLLSELRRPRHMRRSRSRGADWAAPVGCGLHQRAPGRGGRSGGPGPLGGRLAHRRRAVIYRDARGAAVAVRRLASPAQQRSTHRRTGLNPPHSAAARRIGEVAHRRSRR